MAGESLDIEQLAAISYNAVLTDKRKPENQWRDSTVLNAMQKNGILRKEDMGPQVEFILDYRRNQTAGFIATDMTPTSLEKTEVMTRAYFEPADFNEHVVWSKGDDARTPTKLAKAV